MSAFLEITYAVSMLVCGMGVGFGAKALELNLSKTAQFVAALGFCMATLVMIINLGDQQQLRETAFAMGFYTIGVAVGVFCYLLLELSVSRWEQVQDAEFVPYPPQPANLKQNRPCLYNPEGKLIFLPLSE